MNTPLQQAAQSALDRFESVRYGSLITPQVIESQMLDLSKALEAEQAQAVEPTTTKTEQVAGAISKHISTPLIQREVIAAAQYIAHRYMRPTPPAGEQIDWQDMYLKAKSEKEAMAAKYEKDIGPLARVGPATGERAELIARIKHELAEFAHNKTLETLLLDAIEMLEADAQEIAATERQVEILSDELSKCDKAQQVAVPATGERAELIAKYRRLAHAARLRGQSFTPAITKGELLALCDMLEADAKFKPDWVGYRQGVEDGKAEAQQVAVLTDIEQYRMQMAGISTAALGYWSEGDEIHPDYDTPALRDVARLYKKYDQLFKEKDARRAQQVAVPAGWALVPIEPTPAILDAMSSSGWKTASYKAMLAAAQGAKP